jgi:CRP-like cAMP-binding protein/tRNA A-37 threonylcarbamoyl transferase component Bud32
MTRDQRSAAVGKELAPGTQFGRYVIVRRIGTGGMATVYEARHTDLAKRVALKTLHRWLSLRMDVVQRFVLEARLSSRLEHPHVVGISDIGVEQEVPFMAMDLLEGEELAAVLHREGALPVARIADLLLPVISAVATAHEKGIVHRDLKPENIFLARRRPRGEHPMLLDFGISKVNDASLQALTAADELLGTPPYMSPEQVTSGMDLFDARSDQYALGIILYECSTGMLPYRNDDSVPALLALISRGGAKAPSTVKPGIPKAFDTLVMRAMSVSQKDRFPSVIDLGRALLPFASAVVQAVWSDEFGAVEEPAVVSVPSVGAKVTVSPGDLAVFPGLLECSDAELEAFLRVAPAAKLLAGETLFEEGKAGGGGFLLLAGEVEIRKEIGSAHEVRARVRAGHVLGASALVDGALRDVTASARTDCTVVELKREVFDKLHETQPAVAARLLDMVALDAIRRVRAATGRFAEIVFSERGHTRAMELGYLRAAVEEWSIAVDEAAGISRRRP